jgi:eukaryotic-like serine/threonine-protein kinase
LEETRLQPICGHTIALMPSRCACLFLAATAFAQQPGPKDMPQEMVWVDRSGEILGRVGAVQNTIFFPEISPNGKWIAVSARDGEVNDRDVWIHNTADGSKKALATVKGNDNFPIWSSDGEEVIFTSSRSGNYDMYRKRISGDQPEQRIAELQSADYPRSWAGDGKSLIYTQAVKGRDLFLLRFGSGAPKSERLFPDISGWQDGARISPNGKYVAYASNAAGPWEVYVASLADPSQRWKISTELANGWAGGGGQPRWRRDGRELFYVMGNDTLMAVDVETESTFRAGKPKRLFALLGMRGNFPEEAPWLQKYDVSADGQRFVFVRTVPKPRP